MVGASNRVPTVTACHHWGDYQSLKLCDLDVMGTKKQRCGFDSHLRSVHNAHVMQRPNAWIESISIPASHAHRGVASNFEPTLSLEILEEKISGIVYKCYWFE